MEAHRKLCFEQLRHKNSCSIDELKSKLRKLYVQDIKAKREKVLKDKREVKLTEEDDLDFISKYYQKFFGQNEDPWDEDILMQIWEEIKLEEIELAEDNMIEKLVNQSATNQIICPVCLRSTLECNNGQITCACGLMFPLPNDFTFKDFEVTLLTCNDLHSETCAATPFFEVRTTSDDRVQFMSICESCQTHSIILESQL